MNDNGLPFNIRRLEAKDIPTVTSIDRLVFRDPWPESAYVQELYFNPNAHYFVLQLTPAMPARSWNERRAALASHIVGFVGMRMEVDQGHISTLAVRPEWRGWGLGELLFHKAIDQAIRNNAQTVSLEVRVSNVIALNLYAKYGFEKVSRLRGYYSDGEDAFFMRADVMGAEYQQYLQTRYSMLIARFEPQTIGIG
ncbi:MAG TPA: ribosomal protein S18-alanine N-acetyltransferase [Anaerolineae bacterium]|nr:ribosomal protein S18-alanine N-acetyltransferase [Anaerolineae bacterium]HQH40015.1 ribosomal protein S18-alanine N-acetyltransferase [Anaerolineae bacterium]